MKRKFAAEECKFAAEERKFAGRGVSAARRVVT